MSADRYPFKHILLFILFILLGTVLDGVTEVVHPGKIHSGFSHKDMENFIQSGGPPKDGIPPVDKPVYFSVKKASSYMNDHDVVFVVEDDANVRIYPRNVLVWHEIVNDIFFGKTGAVTYCPLTGSVIGYLGQINGTWSSFGTSGKLLNSNLVMYDRETDSYWPQIYGTAINGAKEGMVLETFPVVWTRWDKAVALYPDAKVLSKRTGFFRNYGSDPYGSYQGDRGYYHQGRPFFPVMATDDRLKPKTVVVGVKSGNGQAAVTKSLVQKEKVVLFEIGENGFVAFYDERLDAVRIFENPDGLNFEWRNGGFVETAPGTAWLVEGAGSAGTTLPVAEHFDVMWFAWAAFYPNTLLVR